MSKKVLLTGDFELPNIQYSQSIKLIHIKNPNSYSDITNELKKCWGYILGGSEYLNANLIKCLTELKQIVVMGTVVSSFLDVEAANSYNIEVSNIPAMNTHSVVEFTIAQIINSLSRFFYSIDELKAGNSWYQGQRKSIKEAKIGIIGMGNIGQELLKSLEFLGVKDICYWNRNRRDVDCEYQNLDDLLNKSDVACIHIKYAYETNLMLPVFI